MPGVDGVRRLGLRSRILVVLVGLVTVAIAVVVFVQDTRQGRMLMQLEQKRGLAIARSLAAATATPLLTYNYVSLQQLAERAVQEEGVEYVIVLDKEGAVAGFSDQPERQGELMEDSISRTAFASRDLLIQKVPVLLRSRSPGLDIAVPVYVEGSRRSGAWSGWGSPWLRCWPRSTAPAPGCSAWVSSCWPWPSWPPSS